MMQVAGKETWTLPIESAANLAGCSASLIRALIEGGILQGVETHSGPAVTSGSMVRWLNERHDSLRFPPRVRPHETRTTRERRGTHA